MSPVDDKERAGRIRARIAHERASAPLSWIYLSFADGSLPKGTQFLGGVIVQAHGVGDAAWQAHQRGINPGGEVMGMIAAPGVVPPERFCNRLLTKAEIDEMDREMAERGHCCAGCGAPLPPISPDEEERAVHEMRVNEGDLPPERRAAVCTDCYAKVLAKIAPGTKPRRE